MSAKFTAARRAAFLRAVVATGNFTLAAERAKVSRSWVNLHRAGDAAFRAAGDAAVAAFVEGRAAARQARGEQDGCEPPAGWGTLDGARLVVRGTNGRRVQIARARLRQWCPATETRFIAALIATCNVKAACAEAGLTAASAYAHRKRWRGFAERWDAALSAGYARLDAGLIERACNVFSGEALPPFEEIAVVTGPVSADAAMQLLRLHQRRVHGFGGRPGRLPRLRTMDELRDGIIRKIEAIKSVRGLSPETRDADRAAWATRREPETED